MRKKNILRLFLLIAFATSLYSCVHDELYSATDPQSKEYSSKSLWKEDEKYIKNVMQVYFENETQIKKGNGVPLWDYAMTMDHFDESYLMVPVTNMGKVISVLKVPRHGKKIYFIYTSSQNDIDFFQSLISPNVKKASNTQISNALNKLVCVTKTVSTWYPDDESNPDPSSGAGHWESHNVTTCTNQQMDQCLGVVLPDGTCEGGSFGDGGGYDYPGSGGLPDSEEPENPCENSKSMLNRPNVQQGIANIKSQALQTLSNINAGETGFKEKKDGTVVPADVNSAHQVVFNDVTDSYGGYHNHTATGIHMFSPPDIAYSLFGFAAAQSINDGVGNAYLGMIAAEWCNTCPGGKKEIHYVIRYVGTGTELGNFVYSPEQMAQFKNDYQTKESELANTSLNGSTYINSAGDLNEKGLEKLFFDTLTNMGLDNRVVLQRVEPNGTVYNVTKDSSGSITATPCP
ncbi:hypothetical protein [Chryseobacterium gossypii]|uniref:hypothetical protein n=1 Tax=Chryseobacterium gossypii TaxID=3231602 RepID=UPI0035263132